MYTYPAWAHWTGLNFLDKNFVNISIILLLTSLYNLLTPLEQSWHTAFQVKHADAEDVNMEV